MHFFGSSNQVYCDKLQNRLPADFSSKVLLYKEANCHGLRQNHNYVFILPSKIWQHHLETRAAKRQSRPKQSNTLSIKPCLSLLTFSL